MCSLWGWNRAVKYSHVLYASKCWLQLQDDTKGCALSQSTRDYQQFYSVHHGHMKCNEILLHLFWCLISCVILKSGEMFLVIWLWGNTSFKQSLHKTRLKNITEHFTVNKKCSTQRKDTKLRPFASPGQMSMACKNRTTDKGILIKLHIDYFY
jgi:hypothetical protein